MLSDITIYRDWPIINGHVQVPHNEESDKTRVTSAEALVSITNSAVTRLSLGSGSKTGSKAGQQEWLRLPGLLPDQSHVVTNGSDPVDDVSGD